MLIGPKNALETTAVIHNGISLLCVQFWGVSASTASYEVTAALCTQLSVYSMWWLSS